MKYRCLIFDHDDTVVNSTATIHFPCWVEYLKIYRPGTRQTLEDYFIKNFSPGFLEMARGEFGMSEEEIQGEVEFWKNYVSSHIPEAYPGIREIMLRHRAEGGIIAVISHSMRENILRDYAANGLPEPDIIYGWEQPEERRKPHPWPVEQVMRELGLKREELLMIDDLKPGYDMAAAAGIDFAAAGWANDIEDIENFMRSNSQYYFKKVEDLDTFLK